MWKRCKYIKDTYWSSGQCKNMGSFDDFCWVHRNKRKKKPVPIVICTFCKKSIERKYTESIRDFLRRKFCNPKCKKDAYIKKLGRVEPKLCLGCGKTIPFKNFESREMSVRDYKRKKCCNRECQRMYMKKNRLGFFSGKRTI